MLSRYIRYLNQAQTQAQEQAAMYVQPQTQMPLNPNTQQIMPEMQLPESMNNRMLENLNMMPNNISPEHIMPDNPNLPEQMQDNIMPQEMMPNNMYQPQYVSPFDNNPMQQPYVSDNPTEQRTVGPISYVQGDPPPILSDGPVRSSILLTKELTGYPNYGNPSRNADILYTGNRGTWNFDTPAFLFVPGNLRAQLVIRAVLDDHANVPVSRYSARITVNGTVVHTGRLPLAHGTPAGGIFTNWTDLTFDIRNFRRQNRIVIENTSNAGPDDWIALDWMQIRLMPR